MVACGMLAPPLVQSPSRSTESTPAPSRMAAVLGVAFVAAIWAVLRLAMNREYGPASWAALVEQRAPLPFGHRVLVPLLARPWVDAGVPVAWVFGVSEWLATMVLIWALARALGRDLGPRPAALGAVLVLPVLALPMLLAHRWNVFYPWDTWAMVAIVLVVDAIRRDRMGVACAVVFVAAFNRESIALAPLFAIVLRLETRTLRTTIAWAVWMAFAYAAARGIVAMLVPDVRGQALHLWLGDESRAAANLRWLAEPRNAALWLGSVAALPLFWWIVRRDAPRDLVRLHVPALVGLVGLLAVANAYEPRVYGELVVLAWLVVWTGAWQWATVTPPCAGTTSGWIRVFDRFAGFAVALAAVAAALWVAGVHRE